MHQVCTVWLITKHSWFVEFISFYMQFIPFNDKLQIGETKELSFMFGQLADQAPDNPSSVVVGVGGLRWWLQ